MPHKDETQRIKLVVRPGRLDPKDRICVFAQSESIQDGPAKGIIASVSGLAYLALAPRYHRF